jgi:hypothetical protein
VTRVVFRHGSKLRGRDPFESHSEGLGALEITELYLLLSVARKTLRQRVMSLSRISSLIAIYYIFRLTISD